MPLWNGEKKFEQAPPPPLDKIQKNSYFFWETVSNVLGMGRATKSDEFSEKF